MPRALWTGSIAFGLVNVPVRMYPAVSEHRLEFHYVHEKDSSPIGYQKVCKAEDTPVDEDEIVKAFEVSEGEYVFLEDDDFENARAGGTRTIDIHDFVDASEIDPVYFAKEYLLGPQEGQEKVYALLSRALDASGLVAVATFVVRNREHLGALRVRDRAIVLEQLHFADEIRPVDEIVPSGVRVSKDELAMARRLIESSTSSWKPDRYEDTYTERLRAAIEARQKGEPPHRAPVDGKREEAPPDLLSALRASVDASKGRRRKAKTKTKSKRAA